ncbi:DNA cytosine methyltransferase [Thiopseudomonas alkaliphila]|uniref:DNA cytosine methyltransferase n=1 Tax=Thiopseudomonas alkaliphila TaxID=1697053 RepID=A0AAW7DXH2_9GAMM|nr:DNA cytosine methyltransferase [Thiopseudomonas alkaliphila]MDM1697406.1 DNA cytosine methyltransferase [Thiopseudomonas alkaliphila]
MTCIVNTKLGESKGQSRIWLEGVRLERGGFSPSTRYELVISNRKVTLKVANDGAYTVSKRKRNGKLSPIIDLSNQKLTQAFEGVEMLRVVIRAGVIIVSAHFQQGKVARREERLIERLKKNQSLDVCSLFHGSGVLDKALHAGFSKSGIASTVSVAIEIEGAYIDNSLINNPELWNDGSLVINAPIETLKYGSTAQEVDIVIAGLPCTGASKSGRSKNKLEFAESHDAAGAMFFHFLQMVQNLNPSIVIIECVPEYQNTASMAVIRSGHCCK